MTVRRILTGIAGCLLITTSAAPAQPSKVIELRSARQLIGRMVNDEQVRELIGDVHFVQVTSGGGLVKVWCDRGLQYLSQNRIELYGHVRVLRDSVTITSPDGVYDGSARRMESHNGVRLERGRTILTAQMGEYFVDEKRSHFHGDVVLIDSASMITCNDLTYFEAEARSVATGRVHVIESTNGTDVYGDSLVHIEQARYTRVMNNPRLVKIDTSASGAIDTMVVASRVMHSYQDSVERFIAEDSVRMVRSDMAAECRFATFFTKRDMIRLEGDPIVWSAENQITGDSMTVRLAERRIRSLIVRRHAMAASRADSVLLQRFHQLSGRDMTLWFARNELERVDVERNATSLYYLSDKSGPNGINRASGDRIVIEFLGGSVERIRILGGVQGQYFPEAMIARREPDYNLDGFRWREHRPVRRGLQVSND